MGFLSRNFPHCQLLWKQSTNPIDQFIGQRIYSTPSKRCASSARHRRAVGDPAAWLKSNDNSITSHLQSLTFCRGNSMDPISLGAAISVETKNPILVQPPAAKSRIHHSSIELSASDFVQSHGHASKAQSSTPPASIAQQDVEHSPSLTPALHIVDIADTIPPSFSYPARNRWRVISACLLAFSQGLGDAAPGALIPYMRA